MEPSIYCQRISEIRSKMSDKGIDAIIITGSDPHSSEYPAARWKQVEWVCGFTGEAGDVVITQDHAGLWTDTRYFIQAVSQLEGTGVELHKTRIPGEVRIPRWLSEIAFAMVASASRLVDYQGQEVDLSIYLNDIPSFTKGIYTVEAYTEQSRLGTAELMLR